MTRRSAGYGVWGEVFRSEYKYHPTAETETPAIFDYLEMSLTLVCDHSTFYS